MSFEVSRDVRGTRKKKVFAGYEFRWRRPRVAGVRGLGASRFLQVRAKLNIATRARPGNLSMPTSRRMPGAGSKMKLALISVLMSENAPGIDAVTGVSYVHSYSSFPEYLRYANPSRVESAEEMRDRLVTYRSIRRARRGRGRV